MKPIEIKYSTDLVIVIQTFRNGWDVYYRFIPFTAIQNLDFAIRGNGVQWSPGWSSSILTSYMKPVLIRFDTYLSTVIDTFS